MKDLIELLEAKQELDQLIENEIGNLTVKEFNYLLEKSEVGSTTLQKTGHIAQGVTSGILPGAGGYFAKKYQEKKMLDNLEKKKDVDENDVIEAKDKARQKVRNVERVLAAVSGSIPGLVGAGILKHQKNKLGRLEKIFTNKEQHLDRGIKAALAMSALGAGANVIGSSAVHGMGAVARDTVANASEKDHNKRIIQALKNRKNK